MLDQLFYKVRSHINASQWLVDTLHMILTLASDEHRFSHRLWAMQIWWVIYEMLTPSYLCWYQFMRAILDNRIDLQISLLSLKVMYRYSLSKNNARVHTILTIHKVYSFIMLREKTLKNQLFSLKLNILLVYIFVLLNNTKLSGVCRLPLSTVWYETNAMMMYILQYYFWARGAGLYNIKSSCQ